MEEAEEGKDGRRNGTNSFEGMRSILFSTVTTPNYLFDTYFCLFVVCCLFVCPVAIRKKIISRSMKQ